MTIFSDIDNRIVHKKFIKALKDDGIEVQSDVVEKSKKGDAEAIHIIGTAYVDAKNKEKSTVWLGTSSALGFYESQVQLGRLFRSFNTEDDDMKALEWYERAASNGIPFAYTQIGEILFEDDRFKEAEENFIKAANTGDPYCQSRLGVFYRDGYQVSKGCRMGMDINLAITWFRKAAEQDYPPAQFHLGCMIENGYGIAGTDKYQALLWYLKSNNGGYNEALHAIDRLNNDDYFYIPQKSVSSSATENESEAPDGETDGDDLIKTSKVKQLLRSLRMNNTEHVKVEALENLIDNISLKSNTKTT